MIITAKKAMTVTVIAFWGLKKLPLLVFAYLPYTPFNIHGTKGI